MHPSVETERKFIIRMPDEKLLSRAECIDMIQIYLEAEPGVTRRIRRSESSGGVSYHKTEKRRISALSCIEDESKISEQAFLKLKEEIRHGSYPITKKRYKIPYRMRTLEIDIYPEWKRQAIMEVELSSESEEFIFPDFLTLIKEVTGNAAYSNSSLASSFPGEEDHL